MGYCISGPGVTDENFTVNVSNFCKIYITNEIKTHKYKNACKYYNMYMNASMDI